MQSFTNLELLLLRYTQQVATTSSSSGTYSNLPVAHVNFFLTGSHPPTTPEEEEESHYVYVKLYVRVSTSLVCFSRPVRYGVGVQEPREGVLVLVLPVV